MKNERRYIIIYWLCFFVLISLIESGPQHDYYHAFAANFVSLPLKIIFVSIITDLVAPALFFKNKTTPFLIVYFLLLILASIGIRVVDNYIILDHILTDWQKLPLLDPAPFLYSAIKLQFALAIPFAIKLFLNWMDTQKRNIEISNQKVLTELNFLRSQFHPHFMFNALNSLYSKILSRSEQSADMVLKISSLLRFSLYEATVNSVSLSKEIQYLADYMDLQQVRFQDNVDISFTVEGDPGKLCIEPFLVMPLIENSFKFCQGDENSPAWVSIHIIIEDNWLRVKIENSKGILTTGRERNSGGIGQANVKKRLELLYNGNYDLKIADEEDHYFVALKIKLNA
jgi:two-component system, LytTR family, sensor kinase